MDQKGDYRICVFASPDPLRAGPIDLSVLIQDAETGMALTNANTTVSMTPTDGSGPIVRAVATNAAATNKLLSAALLEVPKSGSWDVTINCFAEHGLAHVRFALNAGDRSAAARIGMWPWFSWPAGMVILFGVHRYLVLRRKTASRDALREPIATSSLPRRLVPRR
jgi:hypothetical protein